MTLKDLAGQQFGRLTVSHRVPSLSTSHARWLCVCSCGGSKEVTSTNLRSGDVSSCGCLRREVTSARYTKHGHKAGYDKSPTYSSWQAMWNRITNPASENHVVYGARGITVCERWRDFANFLADMGERPEGLTLERENVNGNYEPGNCVWATAEQQATNRRCVPLYLIDGQLMSCAQAGRLWGISTAGARYRLRDVRPVKPAEQPPAKPKRQKEKS